MEKPYRRFDKKLQNSYNNNNAKIGFIVITANDYKYPI